jgi:hypothetical protein
MPSKRARGPITKTPETTPQANVALQAPPSRPGATMVQAEHDLAQGQKDTDRYTDATRTFERGPAKKTR